MAMKDILSKDFLGYTCVEEAAYDSYVKEVRGG